MASFMRGRDTDSSSLIEDDKVTSFRIGLEYKISAASSAMLSYESNNWEFDDGTEPTQTWFTLGFNFGLSSNSNLRLFWQVSDMDADGNGNFSFFNQNEAKGGLIGTQLSVKF